MTKLLIFFAMAAGMAFAQVTGDLQINVIDPTGAAVPDATVTVKAVNTGTTRTLMTNPNGGARASQLDTGNYEIEIAHMGFEKISGTALVSSGAVASVPITLRVSSQQDQITVVGEIATVNTVNAQLQTNTDNAAIKGLPIGIGGVLAIATTAPGIIPVTTNNPFLGAGSFNSNGGRGRGNNITIDGATATDVSTSGQAGLGTIPLDAVKEVSLITNQFTAEFGRNSSSQFQILTKGGTNQFHGEGFGFFKNAAFNARDYFDRTGAATPIRDNDWGVFGGGAIIKDRLFYFGSYEGNTVRGLGGTRIANVVTPAELASAAPVAKSILTRYAVPVTASGSLSTSANSTTDFKAFSARFDANLTSSDFFYARVGHDSQTSNSAGNTFRSPRCTR